MGPDGTLVALHRKELLLPAHLACREDGTATRAALAALLWGDREDRLARVSLRQALFRLRAVLGPALVAEGETVALAPGAVVCDAAELRRLAAAGLIEMPAARPAEDPGLVRLPRARGTAVDAHRTVPGGADEPLVEVVTPTPASGDPPAAGEPAGTVYRPRLARRKPGAKLPREVAAEPPAPHPGTDEVLLKRIRTALRALR